MGERGGQGEERGDCATVCAIKYIALGRSFANPARTKLVTQLDVDQPVWDKRGSTALVDDDGGGGGAGYSLTARETSIPFAATHVKGATELVDVTSPVFSSSVGSASGNSQRIERGINFIGSE